MTTGAPIYLVSACGSGEEFVAAFRRYADRAGLFIPMADPVPAGRRGQFALTLADGRVMLEGEAEVISSGLTPSLLHGRVGMTLRFVDPDDNTRTVLIELEKARLSMRPPPPSVPPRQADVPAQPRAVPPAPGGRIDLHNALAQSVAIGDLEQLAVVDKPPPKAGPKFVVPPIPPMGQRGRSTSAPPPTPSATRPPPLAAAAAGDGEPTGPAVIHDAPPVPRMARDSEQTALVPPPSPPQASASPSSPPARPSPSPSSPPPARSSPSPSSPPPSRPSPSPSPSSSPPSRPSPPPARPSAAASGTSPPPISERFLRVRQDSEQTAFTPPPTPPPAAEPGRQRAPRDSEQTAAGPAPGPIAMPRTRTLRDPEQAVPPPPAPPPQASPLVTPPAPRATPPSTPPANLRAAATAAAAAPSAPPPAEQRGSPRVRSPRDSEEQTAAGPPPGPPPARPPGGPGGPGPSPRLAQPATDSGPLLPRTQTTSGHEPSPAVPRAPQPGLLAPAGKPRPIRDSEETAIVSQGDVHADSSAPVPTEGSDASNGVTTRSPALSPPGGVPVVVGAQTPSDALPVVPRTTTPTTRNADDDEPTDLSAVPQALDPYLPGSSPESHIKGGKRRTVIGMPVSPSGASDVRPARPSQPPFGVPEPLTAASAPAAVGGRDVDAHAPTLPAAGPHAPIEEHTPSGDWVFTPTAEGPQLAPRVEPPRDKLPTGDWTIQLEGDTWSEPSRPDAVPVTTPPTTAAQKRAAPGQHPVPQPQPKPEKPTKGPARKSESKIGPPQPFVAGSHESPPADAPPASSEPKIQIDPTLIEPLQPMPAEPPLGGSGPHLPAPQQPYPSGGFALEPPHPMHMGYPQQSGSHMAPPFSPQSTGPHPYPLQPTGPHPVAFPAMPTNPHAFPPIPTGQHTAFPRTGPHARPKRPTMPPRPTANRILVIGASALLVAVFGGAAYIVFGGMSDDDETATTPPPPPTPAPSTNPATPGDAGSGAAPTTSDATASTAPPPEGQPTPALAAPPPAGVGSNCIVDIASTPSGAEVVLDATVLGITPAQLPLPCDAPVKLLVRKPTYVAQQRAVTPTRDGGDKLKVSLVRVTYVVKVSSSPPGATITLNGKSIGTTPATVKLPAFETATLAVGKDGYSTETEHVTPKTNNQTVHSVLKKTPIKRLK